jgi:preprotein translocase subunit SecA
VEKSEHLAALLRRRGIPHEVLNAKQHEREAAIIAMAGHKGAVTVATNMAGRGTDIMLGGSPEFLADQDLRSRGLDPVETPDEYQAEWASTLERFEQQVKAEHDEVAELGGLAVIGTERHESRRIDNQLRGRSGRQGDPGESRFYLSLQDELMRLFKSDWVDWILTTMKIPDDVPIENKRVTSSIASAQGQVESQNFESRKNVLKYDDVMNRQRKVVYEERRRVLKGEDMHDRVRTMIQDVVSAYVVGATDGFPEDWDLEKLWTALGTLYPISLDRDQLVKDAGGVEGLTTDSLTKLVVADALSAYDEREEQLGPEVTRELERRVVLSVLDRKWRENLYEMDYLREGIGLRAYSQRDPLVEYQREGYDMFNAMMDAIKEESVGFLFNLDVEIADEEDQELEDGAAPDAEDPLPEQDDADALEEPHEAEHPHIRAKGLSQPAPQNLTYTAPSEDGDAETSTEAERRPAAAGQAPAGARRPQRPHRSSASRSGSSRNKSKKRR